MIPKPNLDDRTHRQIVEEAIRLIPQYCPEWTNHNPNDPGIALIELFAWMLEMGLYRLNQVPEKTFLTLMELMGMRLGQAQASRVLMSFAPVDGKPVVQTVPAGTQVATAQTDDSDSVVFETVKPLVVSSTRLVKCVCQEEDRVSDNSGILLAEDAQASFPLFQSHTPVERFAYFGDRDWLRLMSGHEVHLAFHTLSREHDLTGLLTWEYFNGHRWAALEPAPRLAEALGPNQVVFKGPLPGMATTVVAGKETAWVRARLALKPETSRQTKIETVRLQVCMQEEGVAPEQCFTNTQSLLFEPLDLSKDFTPFSVQPKFNDAFYLASGEVFSQPGARAELSFTLSKNPNLPKPEGSEDLILAWEFWNGRQWEALGQSSNQTQEEPAGVYEFLDTTAGLTQDGQVFFKTPETWVSCEINQQKNYWLRVRLHTGDFGVGGKYVQNDQGQWVWNFDRPLKPPYISRLALRNSMAPHLPECLVLDWGQAAGETSRALEENEAFLAKNKPVQPVDLFPPVRAKEPLCYFGFDQAFPPEENQLYFLLKNTSGLPLTLPGMVRDRAPVSLAWEYWNGKGWQDLAVMDQTLGLSRSGGVSFKGPKNFQAQTLWDCALFWIRVRCESGSYEHVPYLAKVLTNTVEAQGCHTQAREVLGSSDGSPDQRFPLLYGPVVGNLEVWVAEKERPGREEWEAIVKAEGEDAVREEADSEGKSIWVRWHLVEGFYESGPRDRHYVLDAHEGVVFFGDGFHGRIPPEGPNGVVAERYRVGGGADSNVGINSITVMKKNIPQIHRAWNPVPAEGGADPERVEEAKLRAPHLFRHRFRAVTADDFEWLAREASNQVARAKCLPAFRQEGEVTVVLVPKSAPGQDLGERLNLSRELVLRVQRYLDERRLLTARLHVTEFNYVDISLQAEVVLKPGASQGVNLKTRVEEQIRTFLHPLLGGPDRQGWPFGMAVSKSDLQMVLEKIEGVYYVPRVQMVDEDRGMEVDKLMLPPDTFAYPVAVSVVEKNHA